MESWNYALDGKGVLFSDELEFSVDPFARGGKGFVGWDRESVQSMDFIGFGFPEALKKPFHGDNIGVGMLSDIAVGGLNSGDLVMASPKMVSNSSLETGSSHSTSLMETYSHDSSLIDLKLGRLADFSAAQDANFSKDGSVLSSASPNFQAKKARTMSSRNQAAFCQVYGCHKDLSLSKEYHKKHKVCEVHTKTPRVIVNGIEQRFCQQCSRFHLLVEFDDGKRSCRKRLAGHNARRRKPQFCTLSAKALKLLHPYQGTKFLGTSLPKRTSFLFPNIRPGCVLYPETYQQANWSSNVKLEEKPNHTPQLAIPLVNEEPAKSFFHLHGSGVQYAYEFSPATTADIHVLNTVSTIQESAGALHSKRALSLLSAASQDLSHSAGNTTAGSLINQAGHVPHSMGILNKPVNVGSLGKQVPNSLCSLGMNSAEVNYLGSSVSDTGHPANIHAEDGFVSDSLTAKYWDSSEHGSTMDLLQLSSHLQRVVQERNAIQVENENEELCSFLTTYRM